MAPPVAQTKNYLPMVRKDPTPGILYAVDPIVGNLRYVSAGTFTQGTPSTEVTMYEVEGPQFQHTLTKNIAVMETEVTRKMWSDLKVLQSTLPTDPTWTDYGSGTTNPVQCVTWYKAVLFANTLSQQRELTRAYYADVALTTAISASNYSSGSIDVKWDADGYRLPTEGEWEYFARAGTTGPFSISEPAYGSLTYNSCTPGELAALESVAWFCANVIDVTRPVGSKAANPWGLKDIHGNVHEWCWDWYSSSYPSSAQTDYRGPASGLGRVIRGGSRGYPWQLRSGRHSWATPNFGNGIDIGFRLLRSVN